MGMAQRYMAYYLAFNSEAGGGGVSTLAKAAYFSQGNANASTALTISPPISAGEWHHVALRFEGARGDLFVDGVLAGSLPAAAGKTRIPGYENKPFLLGYGGGGTNANFVGELDEFAMWTRALTDDEIADLHRRGSHRIRFQVRSCSSVESCGDEEFVGPDGTTATHYSELMNSTPGVPALRLAGVPKNRFFQYQAEVETDSASDSPVFSEVGVTVDRVAPTVVLKSPRAGAAGVVISAAPVRVLFSESMARDSLSTATFRIVDSSGGAVAGSLQIETTNLTDDTVTFVPAAGLDSGASYTVTLTSDLRDLGGNALAPVTWTFGTGVLAHTMVGVDVAAAGASTTTAPIDTRGATLLVACVSGWNNTAANANTTLNDSEGNVWVPLPLRTNGSGGYPTGGMIQMYYALGPATDGAHTFTGRCGWGQATIGVMAFNHYTAFDGDSGASTLSVNSVSPGSITPSGADQLFVSCVGGNSGGASWTSANAEGAFGYIIHEATTAVNPVWSVPGSTARLNSSMATFR